MITFRFKENNYSLRRLISTIAGANEVKELAAKASVTPLKALIKDGFNSTETPDQQRWKPLKSTVKHAQRIINKSRSSRGFSQERVDSIYEEYQQKVENARPPLLGLRDFFKITSSGNSVFVTNTKPYATFHQSGTKFIPDRKFLPEGSLPEKWQLRMKRSIVRAINKYMKGLIEKENQDLLSDIAAAESEGFGGG